MYHSFLKMIGAFRSWKFLTRNRASHQLTQKNLQSAGGNHDLLFLLKSFDLLIRMDYPLGAVFAYGRQDLFKNYSYKKAE